MYKEIIDKISQYQKIIIHRHKNPDLDALGSQLGLKGLIMDNFEDKEVYVVGDENEYTFLGRMETIEDSKYEDALVIVLDVAVKALVSDKRYKLGKEVLIIDHHLNKNDFGDIWVSYPEHIATAQILSDMAYKHEIRVSPNTANCLLAGIITDSGRFFYPSVSALTFKLAGHLIECGADLQFIYKALYTEELSYKKLKGHFINSFLTTKHNVAYMKNDKELKNRFKVSTFAISRGMVNQMAGIKGIPIWANFTEDDDGSILCELRSASLPIVDIAKKYGGGGHALACGCMVSSWDETDLVLKDLDALLESEEHRG